MLQNESILEKTCDEIKAHINSEFQSLAGSELDESLDNKIEEWKSEVTPKIESMKPLANEFRILKNSKREIEMGVCSKEAIIDDIDNYASISKELDVDFWKNKCNNSEKKDLLIIRTKLIEKWEGELERQRASLIISKVDEMRNQLIKKLEDWLKLIETIKNSLSGTGLDTGRLWDLSVGNLTNQDIETLKKWADAFKNDANIRKICEMLGRMNSASEADEETVEEPVSFTNIVPDYSSKEEVCGIELGKDLENILPSELSQMNDPDCDILFTLKFMESRLMCFSKQGYAAIEESRMQTVTKKVEEQKSGPIIFCIDTSGSMSGTPEYVAKAVTMYIAMKAMSEKRNCFLINFSTSIETIDLTPPKGTQDLLNFLKVSFHGGTDAMPALKKAVEMTNTQSYRLADIIMISDFVMPSGSFSTYRNEIEKAKKRKCRFHSLMIGNFQYSGMIKEDIFDESWCYDTSTNSVKKMVDMASSIFSY